MIYYLIIFLASLPFQGFSFAENVRHGYVNCTSCHIAPSGGGILNDYGRELSRDILSTWGREGNEVKAFYGLVPKPSMLSYGGDFRYIQTYLDNPYVSQGRALSMQADLEAALSIKNIIIAGTYGIVRHSRNGKVQEKVDSRRHYVLANIDKKNYVRAGKYQAIFGLNVPDHVIATKRGLNFDQGTESYNLEIGHIAKELSANLTLNLGRPDDEVLDRDESLIMNLSYAFFKSYKLGINYYKGSNTKIERDIYGIYGLLGLSPRWYLLSEFDLQDSKSKRLDQKKIHGLYYYNKIGYEFIQGLHFYVSHDFTRTNLNIDHNKIFNFGPGIIWYPRPHFEFNISWQKQKNPAISNELTDFAWITGHYYF